PVARPHHLRHHRCCPWSTGGVGWLDRRREVGRRATSGRATGGNPPRPAARRPNESSQRKLASFLQRLAPEPLPPELPQHPPPDLDPEQSTQDATTLRVVT